MNSYLTGQLGENLALKFLLQRGYSLIKQNYRIPGGEIDLIIQKNGIIIFVEVKTRRQINFGQPEEALTSNKKRKILKTAYTFLDKQQLNLPWRCDLISINFFNQKSASIKHYQNILSD